MSFLLTAIVIYFIIHYLISQIRLQVYYLPPQENNKLFVKALNDKLSKLQGIIIKDVQIIETENHKKEAYIKYYSRFQLNFKPNNN